MEVLRKAKEIKCEFKCPMCKSVIGASKVEMDQVCDLDGGIPSWSLMCPNCDNHITLYTSDIDEYITYEDSFGTRTSDIILSTQQVPKTHDADTVDDILKTGYDAPYYR
jgi:hypothetical protein